jgi:hypothetical protein
MPPAIVRSGCLQFSVKERLLKQLQRCCEASLLVGHLIILNLDSGPSPCGTSFVWWESTSFPGISTPLVFRL